jgi:AraC-like DNA-binding protein
MLATSYVESALGYWTVTAWRPAAGDQLVSAVQNIWLFDGVTALERERVFPDGSLEIIVQIDAAYRPADLPNAQPFPPLSAGGIRTGPFLIEAPRRRVRVLGVRLLPAGAFAIFGTSLRWLTDQDLDLHDVVGRAAEELANRCHDARTDSACVEVAVAWLRGRVERGRMPDHLVLELADRIEADGGAGAIGALDGENGRSRSRFAAHFRDQIGVAPKQFARIVRFRRALELLTTTDAPLGEIAFAAGYYDQPHMNAEFREFAGMTPRVFRTARRYPNSTSLAEAAPEPEQFFQDAGAALL